jgi:hypothetical protein
VGIIFCSDFGGQKEGGGGGRGCNNRSRGQGELEKEEEKEKKQSRMIKNKSSKRVAGRIVFVLCNLIIYLKGGWLCRPIAEFVS